MCANLDSFAAMPRPEDLKDRGSLMRRVEDDVGRVFLGFDFDRDLEWKVGVYFPVVYGLERTVDFYGERRFGLEAPIKGLYVVGDPLMSLVWERGGCVSLAIFATGRIVGKRIVDLEELYKQLS